MTYHRCCAAGTASSLANFRAEEPRVHVDPRDFVFHDDQDTAIGHTDLDPLQRQVVGILRWGDPDARVIVLKRWQMAQVEELVAWREGAQNATESPESASEGVLGLPVTPRPVPERQRGAQGVDVGRVA